VCERERNLMEVERDGERRGGSECGCEAEGEGGERGEGYRRERLGAIGRGHRERERKREERDFGIRVYGRNIYSIT
jgi:hypothetical protein